MKDTRFMQNSFFSPGLTSIDHAGLSMPSVALLKSIRVVYLMFSSLERQQHAGDY